ncbi:unnamed protein product [Pseudo-nitzschia multistriata]|uniref:SOUL heme-binding protein n=1 Tax=Pseudo-nitzschia multistriata TaxID=183589 RepID=A0A448Z470_9STRA|nr:unnamed protein product [Pseudo-nitzschia multistriata]
MSKATTPTSPDIASSKAIMLQLFLQRVVATWLGKLFVGGAAVLTSLRYAGGIYAFLEAEKLERPNYSVVQRLTDGVEIRRYEPYLIAETTAEDAAGFQKAGKQTFRTLAGYIFGKNKARGGFLSSGKNEKMAMTAPVRLDGGQKKKTRVSFVIGSDYTLKTVPKPMEKKVTLRQVPAHTLAVKKFSGKPPSDERVQKQRERLQSALKKADIEVQNGDDTTLVYGYHDPFITPNILRRNEVAVVIDGSV